MEKIKLSKEQVAGLLSTIYHELNTIFELAPFVKKDKENIKLTKETLSNIKEILENCGLTLSKDTSQYSVTE